MWEEGKESIITAAICVEPDESGIASRRSAGDQNFPIRLNDKAAAIESCWWIKGRVERAVSIESREEELIGIGVSDENERTADDELAVGLERDILHGGSYVERRAKARVGGAVGGEAADGAHPPVV